MSKQPDLTEFGAGDRIRRLMVLGSVVAAGRATAAAMTFAAIVLIARGLSPEGFGVFSVIWAFVVVIDRLVNSQSWQSLIKYGTEALSEGNHARYCQLVKIGFLVDLGTAIVGATFAVAAAPLLVRLFGWGDETTVLVALFGLIVLFNLSGVPLAVLRMNDRFGAIAGAEIAGAVCRLGLVLLFISQGLDLATCVIIWVFSEFVAKSSLVLLSVRELGFDTVKEVAAAPLWGSLQRHRSFLKSLIITNMDSVVRVVRETDTLIVGFILGDAAVGTYKIARQLGHMVTVYVDPMMQVIYPDLTRLANAGNVRQFRSLFWKSAVFATAITTVLFLGFVWIGQPLLLRVLGSEYAAAYSVAIWVLAAMLVWSFAYPLTPAYLSVGNFSGFFWRNTIATAIYIPALVVCCNLIGLQGAGIAFFAFYILWFLLMFVARSRELGETQQHRMGADLRES